MSNPKDKATPERMLKMKKELEQILSNLPPEYNKYFDYRRKKK
jgi:hypothetical protein